MKGCLFAIYLLVLFFLIIYLFKDLSAGKSIHPLITISFILYSLGMIPFFSYFHKREKKQNEEMKKKNEETFKNIQKLLNNDDFNSDECYISKDYSSFIELDEKNRKILIGGKQNNTKDINFRVIKAKEVIGVELIDNGKGLLSSSGNTNTLGMAAIGGLLFGGAGAIVGAISGSNSNSVVTEISLRIALDDIKTPYIGINFINKTVSRNSESHRQIYSIAEKWYGMVNILVNREKKKHEI